MDIIASNHVGSQTIWTSFIQDIYTSGHRTFDKIRSFGSLPSGWNYGSGGPARPWVVSRALDCLSQMILLGMSETDAFPGPDGQIMVTSYQGKHSFELTVEVDGTFTVAHQVDGHDVSFQPELTSIQANLELVRIVGELEREKCATFGWSTLRSRLTLVQASLGSSHLAFQAEAAALQSLMNDAGLPTAAAFVHTQIGFTGVSAGNQRYSGSSMMVNSHHLAA